VSNDQLIFPIYNETTANQFQNAPPSKKLSTGAIVGIAVGAAALVAILLLALVFFRRRRQTRRRDAEAAVAAAVAAAATKQHDQETLESGGARRATLSSTYTGVTSPDTDGGIAARHPHHLSELSSDSGGVGVARGTSMSAVGTPAIYELAEGKAAELESDPSDTAAWARNQRRLAGEDQRFELPGDVPLGTEQSTTVTPRQVAVVPDGAEGWSPAMEDGSAAGVSPPIGSLVVTPERDDERRLE
jgi:hypothetical protein